MIDPIERQAAIDSMAREIWLYPNDYKCLNYYENARQLAEYGLGRLPSLNGSLWFYIGETLVAESKSEITAEEAVKKIRGYLQQMERLNYETPNKETEGADHRAVSPGKDDGSDR